MKRISLLKDQELLPLHYDELLGLTCAENLEDDQLIQPTILKKMHLLNPLQKKWF